MSLARWTTALLAVTTLCPTAAEASPVDTTLSARAAATVLPPPVPRIGVMADVGLPDGAGTSLVVRPRRWLRAHGGLSYNMISAGFKGGATLLPFGWGPSVTLEAGHYFDGDAAGPLRKLIGQSVQRPLLEKMGFNFANAHVGFDYGNRRVTVYVHAGMSYIQAKIRNAETVSGSQLDVTGAGSGAPEIGVARAWFPSAKLGLIVYLW
jgi:hypothetical protein